MYSNNETAMQYQKSRIANWNNVAVKRDSWRGWGKLYHRRVEEIYRFLVGPKSAYLGDRLWKGRFACISSPRARRRHRLFPGDDPARPSASRRA